MLPDRRCDLRYTQKSFRTRPICASTVVERACKPRPHQAANQDTAGSRGFARHQHVHFGFVAATCTSASLSARGNGRYLRSRAGLRWSRHLDESPAARSNFSGADDCLCARPAQLVAQTADGRWIADADCLDCRRRFQFRVRLEHPRSSKLIRIIEAAAFRAAAAGLVGGHSINPSTQFNDLRIDDPSLPRRKNGASQFQTRAVHFVAQMQFRLV